MEFISTFIRTYDVFIIPVLAVLVLIMLIMLIILNSELSRLSRRYRKFMRGSKDKNIEEILLGLLDKVDEVAAKSDEVKSLCEKVDKRLNGCVQKVSMMRYKAFDEMSSALSFSIALLDGNNDGIIITGIYGREQCTTYAKPIDRGVPKYDLSDEEEQVLKDAMNKKAV